MIDPEARAKGHGYVMGRVNAYCPACSTVTVTALDCDFDTEDEE